MRSSLALVTCLALVLLVATACSTSEPAAAAPAATPAGPPAAPPRLGGLVPGQALEIARKAALAKGTKLEAFNEPKFAQMLIRNRRLCWAVVFTPRESPAGGAPVAGQLTIFVDDQTGETEFVTQK